MRTLWIVIVGVVLVMLVGCRPDRPAVDPELVSRTGTLRSGFMAIGGEHTGWELHGDEVRRLEVDVTAVQPEAIRNDGRRVTITGRMIERRYVERGATRILMAEQIERAD
jgi:hypothetical protein